MTTKELKNGRVTMFQEKIIDMRESLEVARKNNNEVLESVLIAEIKLCERMLEEAREELKEAKVREKLYLERLDNWAAKNQDLNYKINNMTIDEVVKMQKAKAEYTEKYLKDKEITESFEKQSQVKLGELGA